MKVAVRLFATLRAYLPPGSDGYQVTLEVPEGTRLDQILDRLSIPAQLAQLVIVDGVHESDRARVVHDGSEISIFPPIAGGRARR